MIYKDNISKGWNNCSFHMKILLSPEELIEEMSVSPFLILSHMHHNYGIAPFVKEWSHAFFLPLYTHFQQGSGRK